MDTTIQINLAISLPIRNQESLTHLLQQLYDPTNPNYHHWLTPAQTTSQFGPTESDYQAVSAFAKANGLTITNTHPNRVVLDVNGTVSQIEKTFHVHMHTYKHPTEARMFFAPDVEPSLDLNVPVLSIDGLNNYALPRPCLNKIADNSSSIKPESSGSGPIVNGDTTFIGNDFRNAYVPGTSLNGQGQSVALVEFNGYHPSDITNYLTTANVPAVTLVPIKIDGFDGGVYSQPPYYTPNEAEEVAMDIELVNSMAPGLSSIFIYEVSFWNGSNFDTQGAIDMLNKILTDDLAAVISCSWSLQDLPQYDQIYQLMAGQGQSFFQSSGDYGASGFSDSPFITLVGGTALSTNGVGGSWLSETVWNNGNGNQSGGGVSSNYGLPIWQQGICTNTNGRNVPDVAMDALHVYAYALASRWTSGGTSAAAPLWAGFASLINQQSAQYGKSTIGFINPTIYAIAKNSLAYSSCFNDITSGNNGTYSAGPGYDLCTGLGSPTGQILIDAFVQRPVSVTIDQRLSTNAQVGTIGRWNGISFPTPRLNPGATIPTTTSAFETLQGDQVIYSAQKYNSWLRNQSAEPNVLNHHVFYVEGKDNIYLSQFVPTYNGVTIQSNLAEAPTLSDSVGFFDPWYIDYPDPSYGSVKRNEGMSAPFISRSSPFYPNSSTLYSGNNYLGVFTNQSGPPYWKPPYYSVSFPSQTYSIGSENHTLYFLNWSATGATVQNSTSLQTPVVFTSSSATVTANVKGLRLSNNSSTFSDNSQRKVVQTADGWQHMVYEETINGVSHVFYENKPPNGNWQIVKKGNNLWLDGSSGTSPSIDVETYNTSNFYPICIVWQEGGSISYASCVFSSGNYIIYTSGTYATGEPAGSVLSPSVALSIYGYFIVVYKSSISPYGLKYYIGQLGNNNFVPYHGIIANTNSNSSNPTVSATKGSLWFDIAWQQLTLPPPGPPPVAIWTCSMDGNGNSTTPIQLSSSSMKVNSHVSIVSLPDGPRVGWISDKNGTGDPMQTQAVECNGWSPGYYTTYYYSCKSISMSKLDDESNFYFTFSAIFSTPGWNNYDFVVSGKSLSTYRNVSTNLTDIQLCNGPNSSDMFVTAYNNSAAPYYFQTSNSLGSAGLSKTSSAPIVENREVVIENNSAGVCYSLGSITVDGNPVNFIQTAVQSSFDTTKRINAGSMFITVDSVNKVMISEPFNCTSKF